MGSSSATADLIDAFMVSEPDQNLVEHKIYASSPKRHQRVNE